MNILNKKRGVSEVISVVLIIMITVAAIAVLWTIVIPMINDSIKTGRGCFDAAADITLVQDTGYTCVNRSSGNISLQIKKGSDPKVDLKAIQVIVSLPSGNSETYMLNETMPGLNGVKTYYINNTIYKDATEVSIAPILLMGKTTRTCDATQKAVLTDCQF